MDCGRRRQEPGRNLAARNVGHGRNGDAFRSRFAVPRNTAAEMPAPFSLPGTSPGPGAGGRVVPDEGVNPRPADYKSAALPAELIRRPATASAPPARIHAPSRLC